eukprot:scaffold34_cov260-Pinguiococcus_pyrenoidosus.AAC.1
MARVLAIGAHTQSMLSWQRFQSVVDARTPVQNASSSQPPLGCRRPADRSEARLRAMTLQGGPEPSHRPSCSRIVDGACKRTLCAPFVSQRAPFGHWPPPRPPWLDRDGRETELWMVDRYCQLMTCWYPGIIILKNQDSHSAQYPVTVQYP